MPRGYRGTVIIVARVSCLDSGIVLGREWTDHIRECVVWQPAGTVVVRLSRVHFITRRGCVTLHTVRAKAVASVIPRGEKSTGRAHGKVRLPLRPGGCIAVQLEWRTESYATIG